MFDGEQEGRIPDMLETELASLASVMTETVGAPLHAVAVLTAIAGELEPAGGDPLSVRRHRTAARRLAAHAVLTAAGVHGAFADRPDLDRARARVESGLVERARAGAIAPGRALGAVARAALALPHLEDDGHGSWQLGAIAFVDEALLRGLYDACVELAASALREAAGWR
jgi:hypothetical protein